MKKITLLLIILGIITVGGGIFAKKITKARSNRLPTVKSPKLDQKLEKAELSIDGMWCSSCATGAEYSLKGISGVSDAAISYSESSGGKGWVVYDKSMVSNEQIINAIKPYKATILSNKPYTK